MSKNALSANHFSDQREQDQWSTFLTEEVYQNLLDIAKSLVRFENPLLQGEAEDLVNQTLLRFIGNSAPTSFADKNHFRSAMVLAMRRRLIDMIRSNRAHKRGHNLREPFSEQQMVKSNDSVYGRIAVHDLLSNLRQSKGRRPALVLEMHAFRQASSKEIATELQLSVRTVKRDMAVVREWADSEAELRSYFA